VFTRDNVNCTVTGFTIATGFPYRPNTTSQTYLFWKIAAGGEGNQTVNHAAGDGIVGGIMLVNAGTFDTTTPIDGSPGNTNTNQTFASYTTTIADCLRLLLIGLRNDTNSVSSVTGGSLTWTQQYYAETGASVSDIGGDIHTAPDAAAQAVSGTFAIGTSTSWASQTAIRPVAAGGATLTQNIDDTLSLDDALSFERALALADTLSLADSLAFQRAITIAETLSLADNLTAETGKSVSIADSVSLSDSLAFAFERAITIEDVVSLADALSFERAITVADVLSIADSLSTSSGVPHEVVINDILSLVDALHTHTTTEGGGGIGPDRGVQWFISKYGWYK
jgi:hypothetical protein